MLVESISVIECNTTADRQELYPSTPFFCDKELDIPQCVCSHFYGWVGELCDETSVFLILNRITALFISFWLIFLIVVTLRVLMLNYILEGFTTSALSFTIYGNLFALVTYLPFKLIETAALFNSSNFEEFTFKSLLFRKSISNIGSKGTVIGYFIALSGTCSFLFAHLYLMISWQEVIARVSAFHSLQAMEITKKRSRTLRFLAIMAGTIHLLLIILRDFVGIIFLLTLLSLVVAIALGFVSQRFINSLQSVSSGSRDNDVLKATVDYVKFLRKLMMASWTSLTILSTLLLFSFIFNSKGNTIIGLNPLNLFKDLIIFNLLFELSIMAWYVNSVSVGPIVSEEYFPSFGKLFKRWDKMNRKLFPESTASEYFITSSFMNAN